MSSSTSRFHRHGDRRIDQKPSIGNQHQDSNRGSGSSSIQRNQRGQRRDHFLSSTMNRRYEDHHYARSTATSVRHGYSGGSFENQKSSEVEAMKFSRDKPRRNESQEFVKRSESTFSKNWSRYSRSRESRSRSRGRDRKRRSSDSWARNSRSISRERFRNNVRRYWSKSRSRSSSPARPSVCEHSGRFRNDFDFQESHPMVNLEHKVSNSSRPGSAPRQQSPASSSKSRAKSSKSPAEVRVRNLTLNVTEGHLLEIFARCGRVKNVEFDRHRKEDPRAFIEFYNKADAEYAISTMNEGEIDGKLLEVTLVGGSSRVRATSPKIIFRHRTPPPMPHDMMIKTGRLVNQHRYVDPLRDKVETTPGVFNRKRKH